MTVPYESKCVREGYLAWYYASGGRERVMDSTNRSRGKLIRSVSKFVLLHPSQKRKWHNL